MTTWLIRGIAVVVVASGGVLWWALPRILPPLPPECFQEYVLYDPIIYRIDALLVTCIFGFLVGYVSWEWKARKGKQQ